MGLETETEAGSGGESACQRHRLRWLGASASVISRPTRGSQCPRVDNGTVIPAAPAGGGASDEVIPGRRVRAAPQRASQGAVRTCDRPKGKPDLPRPWPRKESYSKRPRSGSSNTAKGRVHGDEGPKPFSVASREMLRRLGRQTPRQAAHRSWERRTGHLHL